MTPRDCDKGQTAAANARKATISREANRRAKNAEIPASRPAHANERAVKQVNRVLDWMDKCYDQKEFAKLAAILDRLWDMAYPPTGARKPSQLPEHRFFGPFATMEEPPETPS